MSIVTEGEGELVVFILTIVLQGYTMKKSTAHTSEANRL